MLHMNMLVFDEIVIGGITASTFTTAIQYSEILGRYDQLALQVIADNIVAPGGNSPLLSVQLQTSCDGESFATKSTPIAFSSLTIGATTPLQGADSGTTPNAYYVRFAIAFSSNDLAHTASAHVRLFVTGRDQGGVHVQTHRGTLWDPKHVPFSPPYSYAQAVCDNVCKGKDKGCSARCVACMGKCYRAKNGKTVKAMESCAPDCACAADTKYCDFS